MKILFIASKDQQIASIMCALDRMGHDEETGQLFSEMKERSAFQWDGQARHIPDTGRISR